ncbi:MAG: hypothetical protein WBQ18_14350, partial [Solirubrobacteraceae bacterium]
MTETFKPQDLDVPPLPPASPTIRALTSTRLRRAIPLRLALGLSRAVNTLRWRNPGYREWCERSMHYLLDESPRAAEADRLAREFGYWSVTRSELLWHPHHLTSIPLDGVETLRAAQAEGRGVILSFNHHGWFIATFSALRAQGVALHVAVADHYFLDTPGPDYHGRHDRQHLINTARGGEVFNAVGSFPHIRDLLGRGEILALAFDLPGPTRTDILGRTVYTAHGVARTANSTDALIVPVTMWETGGPVGTARFQSPLDPRDHDSVESLHAAVVARHEPALLA